MGSVSDIVPVTDILLEIALLLIFIWNNSTLSEPSFIFTFRTPLVPLSTQIVPVTSYSFSNDDRCDSNTDWINYGQYCAGNFDIPDDFNFEFYGQSFDGSDSMNRIQATGSGVLHFVDDGSTNAVRVEGNGGTCWPSSGRMCDLTTTSSLFPDMMMAPYWARENMDFCGISGGTTCQGMWYRTMPFDGQGKTVF